MQRNQLHEQIEQVNYRVISEVLTNRFRKTKQSFVESRRHWTQQLEHFRRNLEIVLNESVDMAYAAYVRIMHLFNFILLTYIHNHCILRRMLVIILDVLFVNQFPEKHRQALNITHDTFMTSVSIT